MALQSRAFDMPAGRALEGLDLAVEILLDDTHEPRAAELVPARVQRTRVRAAQGSPRPPEHERHERARAPQRGTRQQRACGNLWREDLERGAGRRLCNALGAHVDSREGGCSQDRCSCCTEGLKEHARAATGLGRRRGSPRRMQLQNSQTGDSLPTASKGAKYIAHNVYGRCSFAGAPYA